MCNIHRGDHIPPGSVRLSVAHKSVPPPAWGRTVAEFLASHPRTSEFATPLLTLDDTALSHNIDTMTAWARGAGIHLAPHAKTTMAPALWRRLLDAGAWGLTLATGWQAQVAQAAGVERIMIANAVVDPVALAWVAATTDRSPTAQLLTWVDSCDTVDRMASILTAAGAERPVPVLIELGARGGRTGARGYEQARCVAERVRAAATLSLAGVAGYEGALGHDRTAVSLARIDGYLDVLGDLHESLLSDQLYELAPIVTAGGSAFFDRVAARLVSRAAGAEVIVRAGAFQIHDDGFYANIGPLGRDVSAPPLRSAMHAWVRVVSAPEPRLRLFDGGKRDLPYDEGLPTAQRVRGMRPDDSARLLSGSAVTALNDQHGFLTLGEEATMDDLPVGSVLRLGLSHPCTALDKWRLVPVVEDADEDDPHVIDLIQTHF